MLKKIISFLNKPYVLVGCSFLRTLKNQFSKTRDFNTEFPHKLIWQIATSACQHKFSKSEKVENSDFATLF